MSHRIYVHNYHLDGYGHVNNARYLEFLEEARWMFFHRHNMLADLRQLRLVVARIDILYRHAAVADDTLHIQSSLKDIQSRRLILEQTITIEHSGHTAARAEVTLMPTRDGHVFRLPEALLDQFRQLSDTP